MSGHTRVYHAGDATTWALPPRGRETREIFVVFMLATSMISAVSPLFPLSIGLLCFRRCAQNFEKYT